MSADVASIAAAARRGAMTLAVDPDVCHYSSDTVGLVYERTILNMAGAGSDYNVAKRLAEDPALSDIPLDVLNVLVAASFRHFAKALGG